MWGGVTRVSTAIAATKAAVIGSGRTRVDRAGERAEELTALIDARPGKLLKLCTALGFAGSAVFVSFRRTLDRRGAPAQALDTQLGTRFRIPRPVDLVCAIELAGDESAVGRRRDLVRELLTYMTNENPNGQQLRVALLGYSDHDFDRSHEYRPVVRGSLLGTLPSALSTLSRFKGDNTRYPSAASLEDMLHEAHVMLARSDAGRLLLVAGGRRAHPTVQGADLVLPCPLRYDWRATARRLADSRVSVLAVVDTAPGQVAMAEFWAPVAGAGVHTLDDASAARIAADLSLTFRQEQQVAG
jgi:hypothetical protein